MESLPCQGQLLGALVLEPGELTAVKPWVGNLTSLKLRGFASTKSNNNSAHCKDVFGN